MAFSAKPSTFSIVGHDAAEQEWGIAVASKFLAVGSVVPWGEAGAGALATQSFANTSYGRNGLKLLGTGVSADEALRQLLSDDENREQRQVGLVDAQGRTATFTGTECHDWAGGRTGVHYAAQGNILAGPEVVDGMAHTFEKSSGPLVHRLLDALAAGQSAGGDRRGQQSSALFVVKSRGGYGGFGDRYVDLRVDDHPTPIVELRRLLSIHKLYFFKPRQEDLLSLDREHIDLIQKILQTSGRWGGELTHVYDAKTRDAFWDLCGTENLEERWREGPEVDKVVLDFLTEKFLPIPEAM